MHAYLALQSGHTKIMIRTVDSDVVVIAVYALSKMKGMENWIDFGVGRCRKIIAVHEISNNMPCIIASDLPFFHAFTGCDTVATFSGTGKKTAWKAWMAFRHADECFDHLSTSTCTTYDEEIMKNHRFVILIGLYDRAFPLNPLTNVDIFYTR